MLPHLLDGSARGTTVNRADPVKRDAFGRALQLLRHIVDATDEAADKEWGTRELADALRLPPASVHRSLANLVSHGLVWRNPVSRQFQIGTELYRLTYKLNSRSGVRHASLSVMHDLVARCDENALLALYDASRMEIMFIAAVDSNHPLRYVQTLNEWIPVYAGASGLAIMAFLTKEECRAIINRTGLKPLTQNTITDPAKLVAELGRVQSRGYAFSRGHRNLGTVAFAAPIWAADGRVLGSLILSLPESRLDGPKEAQCARLIVEHANRITERIGGRVRRLDAQRAKPTIPDRTR
jgi:DNA-binding IclR family transcriptional regulator